MAKRGRPKKKVEKKIEIKVEIDGSKLEVDETQEKEPEVVEKAETAEPEVQPKPESLPEQNSNITGTGVGQPLGILNYPKEKLLRIDEVARIFGLTESCVKLWVQNGHLVSVNVGGIRMITNSSVLTCPFKRFG